MQPIGPDLEVTVPWPVTRAAGRGGRGSGRNALRGAVDNEKAYFGLISSGHLVLDLGTGEEVW